MHACHSKFSSTFHDYCQISTYHSLFFPRRYYACRNVRTLSASLRIFLKKYMGMVWKALSRGNSHVLSLDGGGFQCDIAGVEAGSDCSGWHKRKNGCGIPARSRHTMHRSKARTCDWDNRNNSGVNLTSFRSEQH